MKITIEHKDTKITVDENSISDKNSVFRYSDQNEQIQKTIIVIVEQIIELQKSHKKA